jgi:sugar phosphate isomerase/epimerase
MIPSGAQISISNIAWPAEAEEEALALVSDLGFRGLELAPGKVFSHRNALEEARSYRGAAEERGLEIVAFQAILFGDLDVALFGTDRQRRALAEHLAAIARLAGAAGAGACVFGAPGARRRNGLEEAKAFDQAAAFFDALAVDYEAEGVALAIEANAAHYDCDFLTHTEQAAALVKAVGRPGIRLQLDTGTLLLNGEPAEEIGRAAPWAAHFHASEPDLAPLASREHERFGEQLAAAGYRGWRSVEMRAGEDWQAAIRRAADVMAACYWQR